MGVNIGVRWIFVEDLDLSPAIAMLPAIAIVFALGFFMNRKYLFGHNPSVGQ